MNIFKRARSRKADQQHSTGRGDRHRAASHSREMVLADPITSVTLRSLR